MLLGIVSDTHGYFHPELERALADVDLILHAGDVGSEEILDRLEQIAPTRAVYGNVDGLALQRRLPEVLELDAAGIKIVMMHIAGRPGRLDASARTEIERALPQMFICGHSHILQIERIREYGAMLFVNPGAAGKQGLHRHKTCVRIRIEDGRALQAEVVHLDEPNGQPPTSDG